MVKSQICYANLKSFFKNRMRFFSTDFLAQTHFLSKMESTLRKRCDIEKEEREKKEKVRQSYIYIYILYRMLKSKKE